MTERKLRRYIADIPDGGWRNDVSRETYQQLATNLRAHGVPAEAVADVLNDAYWAALAEAEHTVSATGGVA